jgi:hypothetical protein
VQDPRDPAINAKPLATISLANKAITTSGGIHRGYDIQGRHYSHIMDPRTAKPVGHVSGATVIADSASDADALATILCIMPVTEGLSLIEQRMDSACCLVDAQGVAHFSSRWPAREGTPAVAVRFAQKENGEKGAKETKAPDWNGGMELAVAFEINRPEGQRYRRPYVAAWIEDKDKFPVKTLLLWVQLTGPGPQWLPDLRRWYRSDKVRKLAEEDRELLSVLSEPTHKPGQYKVVWDGTDNDGKLVEPGDYTFHLEAAREHGTYQLLKKTATFGEKPFEEELEDGVELKSIKISYLKRTSDNASNAEK